MFITYFVVFARKRLTTCIPPIIIIAASQPNCIFVPRSLLEVVRQQVLAEVSVESWAIITGIR